MALPVAPPAPRREVIWLLWVLIAFVAGIAMGGLGRTVAAADHSVPTLGTVVPAAQRGLGLAAGIDASPVAATVPAIAVPGGSGHGRRVVVSADAAHVWLVDTDERVVRDFAADGRAGCLPGGTSAVISTAPSARLGAAGDVNWLVRVGPGSEAFHAAGSSSGCIGLTDPDARFLYDWVSPGTTVVALA